MTIDTGEPHLSPVLCLHSLFLDPRAFDGLAAAGAGRFRFIAPEFLGQAGRLDEVDATVTMDQCTDDVLALVDRLGLTSVSIVGQSMGGDVAVRIAARRPDLVGRLVLMGSSARAETDEHLDLFGAFVDRFEREGFTPEVVDFVKGILFAATVLNDPARSDIHETWTKRLGELSPRLAHAARGVVQREDALALLPLITARTLIISGTQDQARPPAWSDEMFDAIPNAELWRIKTAGHSPCLEAPDAVIPRVLEFLA
ncbi:3-oxoadipate enol-lactonase [Sinosporangium album]|uniref:3-oxoadipate enol-lactonase n=1 Tax=Sinosporangium album TaxID=504805 RepID=A0A1G7QS06_9ACTN|nr:alpha/beta hydrolase [Sinosporangium album]SDG01321.1 3-oxoadipate enol-lactonase [Sinosporangium album]